MLALLAYFRCHSLISNLALLQAKDKIPYRIIGFKIPAIAAQFEGGKKRCIEIGPGPVMPPVGYPVVYHLLWTGIRDFFYRTLILFLIGHTFRDG